MGYIDTLVLVEINNKDLKYLIHFFLLNLIQILELKVLFDFFFCRLPLFSKTHSHMSLFRKIHNHFYANTYVFI